jgi:hypothetical protein
MRRIGGRVAQEERGQVFPEEAIQDGGTTIRDGAALGEWRMAATDAQAGL